MARSPSFSRPRRGGWSEGIIGVSGHHDQRTSRSHCQHPPGLGKQPTSREIHDRARPGDRDINAHGDQGRRPGAPRGGRQNRQDTGQSNQQRWPGGQVGPRSHGQPLAPTQAKPRVIRFPEWPRCRLPLRPVPPASSPARGRPPLSTLRPTRPRPPTRVRPGEVRSWFPGCRTRPS